MNFVKYLTAFSVFGLFAGIALPANAITVNNDTDFSARFVGDINGSDTGADGLAFMLQNEDDGGRDGPDALGGSGGDIGYGNTVNTSEDAINNSLIVEFDTQDNAGGIDSADDEIGINTNGDIQSETSTVPSTDFSDGTDFTAWIDYDGSNNEIDVFLADGNTTSKPSNPVLTDTQDLAALTDGQALAGFSAATGGETNQHLIREFEFDNDSDLTGDPLVYDQVSDLNNRNGNATLINNGDTLELTENTTDQKGSAFHEPVPFEAEGSMGLVALGGFFFYRYRKKRKQILSQ